MLPPDRTPEAGDFATQVDLTGLIEGHWITSFDVQFTEKRKLAFWFYKTIFTPTAILACFHFNADGTFTGVQRRNKGGELDEPPVKDRMGDYTIYWHPMGIVAGEINIQGKEVTTLHYFLKNANELHWVMADDTPPSPVAQGIMHRVEVVAP